MVSRLGDSPKVGERGATTHRRILDAALEVFAAHGFPRHPGGADHRGGRLLAAVVLPVLLQQGGRLLAAGGRAGEDVMDSLADQVGRTTPDEAGLERIVDWFEALIDVHATYEPVFSAYPTAARADPHRRRLTRHQRADRPAHRAPGARLAPDVPIRPRRHSAAPRRWCCVGVLLAPGARRRHGAGSSPDRRQTVHRLLYGPVLGRETWARGAAPFAPRSVRRPHPFPARRGREDDATTRGQTRAGCSRPAG